MEKETEKNYKKAFFNHKINGVHLTFPNGNSVSSIWSSGSYTDNHDWEIKNAVGEVDFDKLYKTPLSSDTVEIMVNCKPIVLELLEAKFDEKSEGGSVFGHLTILEWLEILNILSTH